MQTWKLFSYFMYFVCKAGGGAYFMETDWTRKHDCGHERETTLLTSEESVWTPHLRLTSSSDISCLSLSNRLTILRSFGRTVAVCVCAHNQMPVTWHHPWGWATKTGTGSTVQGILYPSKVSKTSVWPNTWTGVVGPSTGMIIPLIRERLREENGVWRDLENFGLSLSAQKRFV